MNPAVFETPSIKVAKDRIQLAAVTENGLAIAHIPYSTEAVQLAAVRQAGRAIKYIKHPTEAVQMAAVTRSGGNAIKYIRNPTEAVQMAAVAQSGVAIQHIDTPSEAVQMAAVRQSGYAIKYISYPSDAILATQLIHHPRSEHTPVAVLDRAEALLNAHCPGLGDVYMMGLSMNMSGGELARALRAHLDTAVEAGNIQTEFVPPSP